MTGSRACRYLGWFEEGSKFWRGDTFDDFLRRYPADVACIDLLHVSTCPNFLKSPDWRLGFYGPPSAVFVKRRLKFEGQRKSTGGAQSPYARTAPPFFHFPAAIRDFRPARG